MIAMIVGLIVVGAAITVFLITIKSSSDNLKMIRLSQEMQAAMTMMVRDIRRSGYWGDNVNPSMYADVFTVDGNCIFIAYDDAPNDNDYIGYRWNMDRIEFKADASAFNCASTGWESITDPNVVTIEQPLISPSPYTATPVAATGVEMNIITLTLTGVLVDDAAVRRSLTETIRVRNDIIN